MTFTSKNWWQRAAIVALGLALVQTDDGFAAGPGKGGGLAGLRDRLGQAERPAFGGGNAGKTAGPRVNTSEAKPRPNIFEHAGRIGKPASQPQATHQGRGGVQPNLFNQLKNAAAAKGPRRPQESTPAKTSGRIPPAANQNLGNLLGGLANNRKPGKAGIDTSRQPAAANSLGQLLKDRGPAANRHPGHRQPATAGTAKSPAAGLELLKQRLGQNGNAGRPIGAKAKHGQAGGLESLKGRLPGLSTIGRPKTDSNGPKIGRLPGKSPLKTLGDIAAKRPGGTGAKTGIGSKMTLETLKGRLQKTGGVDLKTRLVNRPGKTSVGVGAKLKELSASGRLSRIQEVLAAKTGSGPLANVLLPGAPVNLDPGIVVPDQTQIAIDNTNTVIGVPGQGAVQAINLATSIVDLVQTAVAGNGLQGTGVETLGGDIVDCPPVTGTVDCPPAAGGEVIIADDLNDVGTETDGDVEMVDGEDLTDDIVDSGLGDDVVDGTESSEEVVADYTVLVVNVTEQPMTYSVRRSGSVWGTYELPAGEEHRFVIPTPELEVQYTADSEPTTITVPGDHVYAFADDNGTVALFLADEE